MAGCWSGVKVSSLATEWVRTDGWLRASVTVRRTVRSARPSSFGCASRFTPRAESRCQIGAWLQTMIPARSSRSSSRGFRR